MIFHVPLATIHFLAAIDPNNEPFTKRRAREEMDGAVAAALAYDRLNQKLSISMPTDVICIL